MTMTKKLILLLDELEEVREHMFFGREEHARLRLDDAFTRVHLMIQAEKEQKDESKAD